MRPFRLAARHSPRGAFFGSKQRNSHWRCLLLLFLICLKASAPSPRQAHISYGCASRNSLLRTWSNQLERIIFAALWMPVPSAWPDWAWPEKRDLKLQFIYEFIHIHTCKWAGKGCGYFKWPPSLNLSKNQPILYLRKITDIKRSEETLK